MIYVGQQTRANEKTNDDRRFLDALDATPPPGPERVYFLFQQFTADYISSFGAQQQGVHFACVDDIEKGHVVHKACCSWSAGQDIQYLPSEKRRTAVDYSQLSYMQLIHEHYKRVTNVLSTAEMNPWTGASVSKAIVEES